MAAAPDTSDRRRFLLQLTAGAVTVLGWTMGGWIVSRGTEAERTPCIRPPGALEEDEFLKRCIRCGRCSDACPNRCIVSFTNESGKDFSMKPGVGQQNTPVIFPRARSCMLCADARGDHLACTEACPSGALQPIRKDLESIRAKVRMGKAVVDEHLCYSFNGASCGVCVRACPLEGIAIKAGLWEKPLVSTEACIGCGSCERACIRYPQAIRVTPNEIRGT